MVRIIGIIATKNRNELLKNALNSAINQTHKLDELIVVSDSDDDAFEKDRSLCEGKCIFTRDIYTRNYAGNLNTAIDSLVLRHIIENGENPDDIYVAFLDDDDKWRPNYIESCFSKLGNKPDFLITGLNYSSGEKSFPLSIPTSLNKSSFLANNPHIQGSNSFIKLSTLLKAGCFDEAMDSTTDRDLFTRVMALNPKYEIINKILVDIDASNARPRLTNSDNGKKASLSYFYSKYSGIMSRRDKASFFERANRFTSLTKDDICLSLPKENNATFSIGKHSFEGRVVFGFVVSDEFIGLRLLKEITQFQDLHKAIVILSNLENPSKSFLTKAKQENVILISLDEAKRIGYSLESLKYVKDILETPGKITDIAISRSILHESLLRNSKSDDVIWILDDDMEFKYYIRKNGRFIIKNLDIKRILGQYKGRFDAVIGSYSGDAPLPTLSTLRTSLLDFVYQTSFKKKSYYRTDIYDNRDYYYDFSMQHIGLETPLKSYAKTLDDVFSGKATSRKLFVKDLNEFSPYSRGGNTIIFNKEILKIPNISPRFDRKIARRSDYFWVQQAKLNGFKIIGSSFTTLHSKTPKEFNLDVESDKLLKDLLGSSFTKAMDSSNSRETFYRSFKKEYENRLTRIIVSFYRIIGLLAIANANSYKGINESFVKRFIEKTKYYLYEPKIRASFDVFGRLLNCSLVSKKDQILHTFGKEFEYIGSGHEGVVFKKDNSIIYKVFYKKQDFTFIKKNLPHFEKCAQLFQFHPEEMHHYSTISYKMQGVVSKYEGGHAKEIVSLLKFLKDEDLVITNIKKDNFILLDNKLKYIDYGKSFSKYTESNFKQEIQRAYEMLRYPFLSNSDFTELIEKDYMGEDNSHLFGIENFKKLLLKREKERIHDGTIIQKIREYKPKTVLDYGAGKCKILNQLKNEMNCYVFDIDLKTIKARASKGVTVIEKIEDFHKQVDLIVSNLVLCNVSEEYVDEILTNIAALLKKNSHAIISICDPFFDSIHNTELRTSGYHGKYEENSAYTKEGLYGPKGDYHRPFSYYENILKKHGFEISDIIETDGVNVDSLNPIGEHLVFDVINKGAPKLNNCTLMIKTCPMDHQIVIPCIKQIVSNLEKGSLFAQIIVSVDTSKEERARRFSNEDEKKLMENLRFLKNNGTIDDLVTDLNHGAYTQFFGEDSEFAHAKNGQQLLATLNGFSKIKTRYVFQTDVDILYKTHYGSFEKAYENFIASKTITGTIGIARSQSLPPSFGKRSEVRTCFLDLDALKKKLPLMNVKNEKGQFILPWHRALDKSLSHSESVRFADSDIYFVHLPNEMKKDNFLSAYLLGNIPLSQEGNVDASKETKDWYPKSKRPLVVFSRGRNVGVEKLKRLVDSLKTQSCQDFDFVYIDDCSESKEEEYLYMLSKYDHWCKKHMIFIQNVCPVDSLANFDVAMRYIITNPNSIVINIDGDDALMREDAISIIFEAYKHGADMTSGGCFRADKPTRRYSISSFKRCWERNGDNIWLHPKTFRRYLVDYIGDFILDGEKYIDVHTDYALLLPIAEMAKAPLEIKKTLYYFEPSKDNENKINKYDTNHRNEVLKKLLEKAERGFMKPIVAVIGDAVLKENDEEYKIAEEIGKLLIDAGYRVQTGGLGGVMEAALKGAKTSEKYEYGDTIAILPGTTPADANNYADIKVATGLDNMRARQVVDTYAVIAIGGGAGTLAEIATAWSMYKLILAWNKKGWSGKLAGQRVDERIRYPELPDDKVYSFSKTSEAITLIQTQGNKYQKEYHGIKWRKKK